MKIYFPLLSFLFYLSSLSAQRVGADTLSGYIVSSTDTIAGKIVLTYKLVKEKKEFHKEYETEDWFNEVTFINQRDSVATFTPKDVSAYGWNWNDTSKMIFRSTNVIIPHKGALLLKGNGIRFLKVEFDGPMSLFLYPHRENGLSGTTIYNDRYLKNEKDEFQLLKVKVWLGIAYNLSEQETWFPGYPDLSKFNLKNMLPIEVWLLVAGYNDWKKGGK